MTSGVSHSQTARGSPPRYSPPWARANASKGPRVADARADTTATLVRIRSGRHTLAARLTGAPNRPRVSLLDGSGTFARCGAVHVASGDMRGGDRVRTCHGP